MDSEHCPICGDGYGLVEDRYVDGGVYEPVWCSTCHRWHENVYKGVVFVGCETCLDPGE